MKEEYRQVWANRFLASGSIIMALGFILAPGFAPFCPVGEPEWRLQYQSMLALRILLLYAFSGILLITLGLLLRLRIFDRKNSG